MEAEEQAQEIVNTILTIARSAKYLQANSADGFHMEEVLVAGAANKIRAAETEAWNAAVEACAEWLDREFEPHNMDSDFEAMRKALKRGQS